MSNLTVAEKTTPAIPGAKVFPTGMVIEDGATFSTWKNIGAALKQWQGGLLWWVGDWVSHGQRKYNDGRYETAVAESGYDYGTIRNAAWVAQSIPLSRRCDKLSWSHHSEVVSLAPKDQDKWLAIALKEQLSQRELKASIKAGKVVRTADFPAAVEKSFHLPIASVAYRKWHGDVFVKGLDAWDAPTLTEVCAFLKPFADDYNAALAKLNG